uniref:Uncharacterized protein n=1 Tax=Arundo donax TaxID=35708 RepID=A0A0A9EVP8_ARUDO
MVKAVVGDEVHLKALDETLSSSAPQAQVGLVVGKLSASSDRALVYSLLPTPPTDADAPACSLRASSPPPRPPSPRPPRAPQPPRPLLSSTSTGSPSTPDRCRGCCSVE